ncbi:MAG TPA: VCBS repeat-containing protein [Bryobacteraceae bacterium]|nr:VCBS repeat-containing protein [Bryobacteraceae bacterium]
MRWFVSLLIAFAGLLQAQGAISFDRMLALEDAAAPSAGISVGDLNGDGKLDLVLAKGRHWPVHNRVLLNDGKGGYKASNLGAAADRTYSAALADIDGDRDLDVVVSNDSPDRKLVYKNDGKGRFTESGSFGQPDWSTRYITLADLNGDRFPDVIVANRGGDTVVPSFVCFNDRKGAFRSCVPVWKGSATSIVAADLDGDDAVDLFIPHREGGQSVVLWNDGEGRFPNSSNVGIATTAARIGVAGDLDGDGRKDVAFIDERLKATFVVLNRGNRQFGDPAQLPATTGVPYALALGDLNGDRRLDVVVGFVEAPGVVYLNSGNASSFQTVSWNDAKGAVYDIAFSDVDGDGATDILAARSDAPNAIWFGAKSSSKDGQKRSTR